MAFVNIVTAEEATGDLLRAYERASVRSGSIGPPFEGMTNNGAVLLKLMQFTTEARFGPTSLTRLQHEMIATYVSAINDCVF